MKLPHIPEWCILIILFAVLLGIGAFMALFMEIRLLIGRLSSGF